MRFAICWKENKAFLEYKNKRLKKIEKLEFL